MSSINKMVILNTFCKLRLNSIKNKVIPNIATNALR